MDGSNLPTTCKISDKSENIGIFQDSEENSQLARERRDHIVTTSIWSSKERNKCVLNKTLIDVSVELRQDFSVARLRNVMKQQRGTVPRVCNNDVPLACSTISQTRLN